MYSVFVQLCEQKGVTANQVSKATGIRSSLFTDWKTGRSAPKTDKLKKIADYFNVSLDYLMTGVDPITEENTPYYTDPEVREIANDIYENPDLRVLFDASRTMSKEDIEMVTDIVNRIRKSQEG